MTLRQYINHLEVLAGENGDDIEVVFCEVPGEYLDVQAIPSVITVVNSGVDGVWAPEYTSHRTKGIKSKQVILLT